MTRIKIQLQPWILDLIEQPERLFGTVECAHSMRLHEQDCLRARSRLRPRMENGKAVFTLPGESGNVDYPALFGQLAKGGYRGDINVEVSSMVSRLPDYDAVRAAKSSYEKMAAALREAGIQRPRKS